MMQKDRMVEDESLAGLMRSYADCRWDDRSDAFGRLFFFLGEFGGIGASKVGF